MKNNNVGNNPETLPEKPETLPDTEPGIEEEPNRPDEDDPFNVPGPKINPTPKGKRK